MRMAVPCLACVVAAGPLVSVAQEPRPIVDRFLESTDSPLVSYRAVRRLEAAARDGRMRASLTATTSLGADGSFRFDIQDEAGSGVIRSRVLRPALEAERRAHASGDKARSALSPLNYEFSAAEATGHGVLRVGIRPRRVDAMLIEGSILLTEDRADLLQIDGRLVKPPSFWTRRVDVVRRYARLAGVRVPVAMESTAEVRLAGRSTFSMRYEYEAINGVALPQ